MEESAITKETTVGEVVAADYRTATVFEARGIDFCCGGRITLADACRERGIEPAELLREIEAVTSGRVDPSQNYNGWPLPFLADYIVNTHHVYLKENTGQIAAYLRKIGSVHGTNHPELLEIGVIFERVAADLESHLREEEELFFPAVKRADSANKAGTEPAPSDREIIRDSLRKAEREHEEVGDAVHHIRRLSRDYALPSDACNTFMVTYQKLREFEDDLHRHVHLENNILFPKAGRLLD